MGRLPVSNSIFKNTDTSEVSSLIHCGEKGIVKSETFRMERPEYVFKNVLYYTFNMRYPNDIHLV